MIFALALCLKALVPSGYMFDVHGQTLVLEICPDQNGGAVVPADQMPGMDMAGMGAGGVVGHAGAMHSATVHAGAAAPHGTAALLTYAGHKSSEHHSDKHKGLGNCPYSVMAMAPLKAGTIDIATIFLVLFAVAVATTSRQVRLAPSPFLRPPSRGPPARA